MRTVLKIILLGGGILVILLFVPCTSAEVKLTTMVTFDGTNGCDPESGLTLGKDGNLYGTLSSGGWYDAGIVFRMAPDGKCIILMTFGDSDGTHPDCLIQGKDGNFYGTTLEGVSGSEGSIFKMAPDGTITTLAAFGYDNGYGPWGLVQGQDGNLYGKMNTFTGKSTFEVTLDGKLIIPATNSMPADNAGLLKGKDGNSYGTTFSSVFGDRRFFFGSVFKVGLDGTRTTLAVFNQTNGANPLPDLVQGRDGNIYGITTRGGAFNQGTIFRVNLTESPNEPPKINVPVLIHAISNKFDSRILDLMQHSIESYGKIVDNGSNGISGTNKAFGLAMQYAWEIRTGHRPPKVPDGITRADISNAIYLVSLWAMSVPPEPINFYGKVVDENDQPITGATAHFVWDGGVTNMNPRSFTDTGKISADITADSAGLFSLTNAIGTELDVSVGKTGYYISRRNGGVQHFKYSKMNFDSFHGIGDCFKPDSNHPVIYYLRKKGVGVDLITSQFGISPDIQIHVPRDGTPIKVDLLQRKTGDNGQMQISELKPEFKNWKQATNWIFKIEIPDGGFVGESDEFPFEAPAEGYQSIIEFDFQKNNPDWATGINTNFYIKFGNPPLYGRLQIQTGISYGGAILTYAINPTGSQNLEPK
jgi:uncharacterized repeat protein (TIGR03803 family)